MILGVQSTKKSRMTHKDFQLLRRLSYRKDKVKTMISDKTDSSSDKNTKKAKNFQPTFLFFGGFGLVFSHCCQCVLKKGKEAVRVVRSAVAWNSGDNKVCLHA